MSHVAPQTFKDAKAFLNVESVAVYDEDANDEDIVDFIPETFRGTGYQERLKLQ
jgi:hypothetical protein